MTPEQKQRIEQIKARQNLRSGRVMLAAEGVLHDDVDFLLSLVKSQEEDYALVDKYLAELKQELGLPPNAHASISLDRYKERVATSMRSACVEKLRTSIRDPSLRFSDEGVKAAVTDWTNILISRLESLSIEKPKE